MSGLAHHVVRRGIDVASKHMSNGDDTPENPEKGNMPPWGIALLFATTVFFVFAWIFIAYTYQVLVATLAAVENPQAELYMEVDAIDPADPNNKIGSRPVEPNLLLVKPRPITSSLRGTVKHLREHAGRRAQFRGMGTLFVYLFLSGLVANALSVGEQYGEPSIRSTIAQVAGEVAMANIAVAFIHIVISNPSSKRWYQRVPSPRTWVKMAPAALVSSLGSRVVLVMSMLVSGMSSEPDNAPLTAIGALIVAIALTVLVEIPATVTFIRVAASMLPEDHETIVPFDRTFGGKVTPAVVGGSGHIGLIDAWKSFDWASRLRFIMVFVKSSLMQLALVFLFAVAIVSELGLITGGNFSPEKLRDLDPRRL